MAASSSSTEGRDFVREMSNMIGKVPLGSTDKAFDSTSTAEDKAKKCLKKAYLELLRLKSTKDLDQTTGNALSIVSKDIEKALQDLSNADLHLHCATGYVKSMEDTIIPHHLDNTESEDGQENRDSMDDAMAGRKRKTTDDESDDARKGKGKAIKLAVKLEEQVDEDYNDATDSDQSEHVSAYSDYD
ncbi:hypothetical protein PTT_12044 [Pyrenophora teres f. teres 0-1]|uniref:Uncharacterized protein n=1 Tax=Pyrenophora teres f. teres (strain 0-1) TaxID=861557 RepID=E3RSV6_PYRTT|nr:hypothetical protein PTT_12044 [Pyrenophora teres f. teres 0-1]KAE8854032.1 hypothetical protein HRS9122_01024 [Pyrenophora teres f. teres]